MTHILKRKDFARWQAVEKLSDAALCKAVQEMESGLIDPVRGKPRRSGRGRMARTAWPSLPSMGVGCIKPVCNAFKPTNMN